MNTDRKQNPLMEEIAKSTKRKRPRTKSPDRSIGNDSQYGRIICDIICERQKLRAGTNVKILGICMDIQADVPILECQCLEDTTIYLIQHDYVREINEDELELLQAVVNREYAPVNPLHRELFANEIVTIIVDWNDTFFKVRCDDGTYTFVLKERVTILGEEKLRSLNNELYERLDQWHNKYGGSQFGDQKICLETNTQSRGGTFLIHQGIRILFAFTTAARAVTCEKEAKKCLRLLGKFEASTMEEMERFLRWIKEMKNEYEKNSTSSSSTTTSTTTTSSTTTSSTASSGASSFLAHVRSQKEESLEHLVNTFSMTGQFELVKKYTTT